MGLESAAWVWPRIACLLPLGIFAGIRLSTNSDMNPLLLQAGYLRKISNGMVFLHGMKTVDITAYVLVGWNAATMFTCPVPRQYILVFGLVDIALSISLAVGVVLQSRFIPHSRAGCRSVEYWRLGDTDTISDWSLQRSCRRMVERWSFAIAVIIMYSICGIFTAYFGYIGILRKRDERRGDYNKTRIGTPIAVSRFAFRTIYRIMQQILQRGRRSKTSPSSTHMKHRFTIVKQPRIKQKLPAGALGRISSYLHYVDLIRLQQALPEIFVTNTSEQIPLENLQTHACNENKTQCMVCKMIICDDCSQSVTVGKSAVRTHLERCAPYCTNCFYDRRWAVTGSNSRYHKRKLGCGYDTPVEVNLCQLCVAMDQRKREKVLEAQDRLQINQLVRQHPLACTGCQKMLSSSGPWWWECKSCRSACYHRSHPAWA